MLIRARWLRPRRCISGHWRDTRKHGALSIHPQSTSSTAWAISIKIRAIWLRRRRCINNVETLFPAPQARLELVKQETAEIQDKEALEVVENAAQDIDRLLQAAAKEALTGHQYLKVVIKGRAQTGD